VQPNTPGAVLLQQPNSSFFDRALPASVPQSIAVVISDGILHATTQGDQFRWLVAERARDGIDWDGLAGMLGRGRESGRR
jgi:hypothetical protein